MISALSGDNRKISLLF